QWKRDHAGQSGATNPQGDASTNGVEHYYHVDHLGTSQRLTNAQGETTWRMVSEAFGKTFVDTTLAPTTTGTTTNNLRFPGQYEDQETGTYYNYMRTYLPMVGRYGESDPIGLGGGVNTYGYVFASPMTRYDPKGLLSWTDNGTVTSNDLATGSRYQMRPGLQTDPTEENVMGLTTGNWSIEPVCVWNCETNTWRLSNVTVSYTTIVRLRPKYACDALRQTIIGDENDHVQDFVRWARGEGYAAAVRAEAMAMRGSYYTNLACVRAAYAIMQSALQRSFDAATNATVAKYDGPGNKHHHPVFDCRKAR
ncbi:MAG: RHS repeat-associated core domain-containing protein, partial [Betaproteobacteria bacterium]